MLLIGAESLDQYRRPCGSASCPRRVRTAASEISRKQMGKKPTPAMSSPRLTFPGFWPAMNEYPRYLCNCWTSSLNINAWIPVWVLLFPGALHMLVIKDEILSITITTASIDPKCQSQDQSPLVWPTTQRTNKTIILLQTVNSRFIGEEMASGCGSTDWGMLRNREFGQHDRQGFQSPRCLFFDGLFGGTTPVHVGNWGTAGVGKSCLHYSQNQMWVFCGPSFSFYLWFWNTLCC